MNSLIWNTETARQSLDLCDIVDSAILYACPFARALDAHISFNRPAYRISILGDANQLQIALNNPSATPWKPSQASPANRHGKSPWN